jgi:transcriptional regulator with XRE-family HTH domain
MSSLRSAFGRTLREVRLELGLSQEKLAQKVKVSRNFLGSVERGESSLSLEVVERIAKAVGMSLSDLMLKVESYR